MIRLELSQKEMHNLTNDEIEIAKARKLEIMSLPHLRRNIEFFYAGANIPKKANAYNRPLHNNHLEEAIRGKEEVISTVCKPLCEMIAGILQENGINAETVSCDTDMFRHTDVLITTASKKQYIINYLEDMENIQTSMKTPDFASEKYYIRRYKKFENGTTTDGKRLENINFLSEEQLDKIDSNLGYKKYGMYMDDVIKQIQAEFKEFKIFMSESEYLTQISKLENNNVKLSTREEEKVKEAIYEKYNKMSDDEILEYKLDWIFNYFNDRMDISGHTDFVMYYSRLLLKEVLDPAEYDKLVRYDCFTYRKDIPKDSTISNILDYENDENKSKIRFCLLSLGDKAYAFSTKPNVYKKLNKEETERLKEYAKILKSERPSDLVLNLCDRGNALPLVFHPLGSQILNERAELIESSLSEEDRRKEIEKLAASINGTDGDVTSLTIPYPNGEEKYIYINKNKEFTVRDKQGTIIYHYNEQNDTFDKELVEELER